MELSKLYILLEVSLISKNWVPCEVHLEQALHIVGYLKKNLKFHILFYPDYPEIAEQWFKSLVIGTVSIVMLKGLSLYWYT